jgi:hypothetical protein
LDATGDAEGDAPIVFEALLDGVTGGSSNAGTARVGAGGSSASSAAVGATVGAGATIAAAGSMFAPVEVGERMGPTRSAIRTATATENRAAMAGQMERRREPVTGTDRTCGSSLSIGAFSGGH